MPEVVGLAYKARYVQNLLDDLAHSVTPPQRAAILARVDPAFLLHVARATPTEMVEGKGLLSILVSMRAELGDEGYVSFWREYTVKLVRIPLLAGLLQGAVKVLGLTPHQAFKNLPRARSAIVRAGGDVSYQRVNDTTARLTCTGYAREAMESGIAALTMSGLYEGVLRIVNVRGSATVDVEDIPGCRMVHTVTWSEPARP